MELLIQRAKQLVTVAVHGKLVKVGPEMREIGLIEEGSVYVKDGIIQWVGREVDRTIESTRDTHVFDASGKVVMPGFVDPHTHLLFDGSREIEFAMRSEGKTYEEIAHEGGGILNTVKDVRKATKRELKRLADNRMTKMMEHGTTTVEIKSGYGLDMENEIKMLHAIDELAKEHYMTVVPTFLGAHALPSEYKGNKGGYIHLLLRELIPYVGKKHLAAFCDVFCEKGYFDLPEAEEILNEAKKFEMRPKIHAEELSQLGGAELAAKVGATSADHLEYVADEGIKALNNAEVVAVLLPGVSFFLGQRYAPARKLVEGGVAVALGTDFNPGSCMSFSMPLMMTIACTQMKMTPEEVISAATINAAAALGLSHETGSIEIGKRADLIVLDIPNYQYLPYHFGVNHVCSVIKNGTILEF